MTTIELTDDELELVRTALHAFLDDFGHDEIDVVRRVQGLLARLATDASEPPPAA
jgi:hypothetical protein